MALGKLPDQDGDEEGGGDSIFAEINITPLTDVFLVMVIIFMVSALAVQVEARQEKKKVAQQQEQSEVEKRSGLKVNLPSGQAQEIDPSKQSLVLTVPLQGDVDVGGKSIPDTELDNLFRAAYARDKNTQVVLKADKGVQHGRVVNLMERAKQAGLTRLAIGTSGG
ncbi:MAG TPA: biopolymer transporter ExbD [Kofleriaceae bacterium]|jgi:biopolymer transport protein ExbD|nr:biopolymer transporter ExbD [Kofleriaceae bacterium]